MTDFVVGRYGQFDALAANCVKVAKKRHPEVTLNIAQRELSVWPERKPAVIAGGRSLVC